jgi:rhamnogalacturonyl hydrolase YesR
LLYLYDASKEQKYLDHVLQVWQFREDHQAAGLDPFILFTCLHFETYLRTGDRKFIADFPEKAYRFREMLTRDADGAVCFPVRPETKRILADMLQAYAVLMARAGWLTGDQSFFIECMNQYRIFRDILRDPSTGLWHQGRNWSGTPGTLSPGYWNRGQGWVLRGLVDSLDYLPEGSVYSEVLQGILKNFVTALIPHQDLRGMWHQLTDHPGSWPETSGTALIVHHIYKAFHRGWLPRDPYLAIAEKAINALLGFVRKDGTVMNTSLGTAPLQSMEGYLYRPAVPGDPHAAGTMLMACAGPYLARRPVTMAQTL